MHGQLRISSISARDKPRERLMDHGASALSDRELLAVILRSGNVGSSALNLAGRVLAHFGGFKGLLSADIKQLMNFDGIGSAKATSIKALCEISLRMQMVPVEKEELIEKPEDVFNIIRKDLYSKKRECLYLISLDVKSYIISKSLISIGTFTQTLVHPREIYTAALLKGAFSIILVHNHPSGDPKPSSCDIELTKRIAKAGVILGVPLIDHIIVCNHEFVSMKSEGVVNFSIGKEVST